MSKQGSTLRDSVTSRAHGDVHPPAPGLALIFSRGKPQCCARAFTSGALEIGRGEPQDTPSFLPADPKMSRRHASVTFDGERCVIVDHGSQNGTYVNGSRMSHSLTTTAARVLRTGDSLYLFSADVGPLLRSGIDVRGNLVIGPTLGAVLDQAAEASQFGHTLHISGESGSGKEAMARTFHEASRHAGGAFVAVNCATITPSLAERLLFGARRGSYSGAVADTEGLVQAADGGTLFLDEIGELDLAVQAKLLRALESGEVLPIGATKPRQVSIQLASASHRELRAELSSGRFREDLFFRISLPQVIVPPLRQRLEEIPWLICSALQSISPDLEVHSTFVEACLLRVWPGNVRELLAEVRAAAHLARTRGLRKLEGQHLSAQAGVVIERTPEPVPVAPCAMPWHPPIRKPPLRDVPEQTRVENALSQANGNISAAARALGLHRTQLKRLMDKHGISLGRVGQSLDGDSDLDE